MRRQRYNTVSASEADIDQEPQANNTGSARVVGLPLSLRAAATSYARIASSDANSARAATPVASDDRGHGEEAYDEVSSTNNESSQNGNGDEPTPDNDNTITVTILDYTHKRWNVMLPKDSAATLTVLDLKRAGAAVHQIPIASQRLIHRGALLDNATTLAAAHITHETVVHLFPKPRVIVVNGEQSGSEQSQQSNTGNSDDDGGARIPTIVYDQAEADRRGEILVLSSMDYIEAVNNVKLFSFMLLIVSSMELLNLIGLFLGGGGDAQMESSNNPSDPYDTVMPFAMHDDFFDDDATKDKNSHDTTDDALGPHQNAMNRTAGLYNNGMDPALALLQTWTPLKYADVLISLVGIYVALQGIRASNMNDVATAKTYLWGTSAVAVAWLAYNYTMSLHVDQAVQTELAAGGDSPYADMYHIDADSDDNVYNQALQVMILPAMVWGMCIFRAWQFHALLAEAETEAAARIAAETNNHTDIEMTAVVAVPDNSVSSSSTTPAAHETAPPVAVRLT
jgi:Ubiquitin family